MSTSTSKILSTLAMARDKIATLDKFTRSYFAVTAKSHHCESTSPKATRGDLLGAVHWAAFQVEPNDDHDELSELESFCEELLAGCLPIRHEPTEHCTAALVRLATQGLGMGLGCPLVSIADIHAASLSLLDEAIFHVTQAGV